MCVTAVCPSRIAKKLQVEQLDKLEQYTTPATEGVTAEDGELGELSQQFYQAAVQVCVCLCVYVVYVWLKYPDKVITDLA